jgi:hypothetical protein
VDNTFSSSATGTVEFGTAVEDFEIRGNVNLNYLALSSTSTNGLIQGNTFYARLPHVTNPVLALITSASSSMIRVINNTFTSYLTSSDSAHSFVQLDGYDLVFATNTLRYAVTSPSGVEATVIWHASGTNYFGGNFVDAPNNFASCSGLYITQPRDNRWVSTVMVTHNTFRLTGGCTSGVGISFADPAFASGASSTVGFTYNTIYNGTGASISRSAIAVVKSAGDVPLTQSNAYNGAFGFDRVIGVEISGGGLTNVSAATSRTTNPFLKVSDADTTNDLQTADFSPYLDVNGSQDIGATSISRRSHIYLDDNGTIDYAGSLGVDATSTADISGFLLTGDTVHLASGTYSAFNINSSSVTSSISIVGAGATTVIQAGTNEDALTFTNVSSSSVSYVKLQDASSVGSATYTATRMNFTTSTVDYAEAAGPPLNIPGNATLYFSDPTTCGIDSYTSDGANLTSVLGTGNIHVALMTVMGAHFTFLIPNSVATNASEVEAIFSDYCGGPGMASTDQFISNVFTFELRCLYL